MATESVAALPLSKAVLSMEIDPPGNGGVLGNVAPEDWRNALNKVVPAVVVLRTTATRAFDTEAAGASYATGFVVDKRRGILLTNRHVVRPGTGLRCESWLRKPRTNSLSIIIFYHAFFLLSAILMESLMKTITK